MIQNSSSCIMMEGMNDFFLYHSMVRSEVVLLYDTANVTPLFKQDDNTLCSNYRPISLFSNLSKIIERLTHTRLTTFLNTNKQV